MRRAATGDRTSCGSWRRSDVRAVRSATTMPTPARRTAARRPLRRRRGGERRRGLAILDLREHAGRHARCLGKLRHRHIQLMPKIAHFPADGGFQRAALAGDVMGILLQRGGELGLSRRQLVGCPQDRGGRLGPPCRRFLRLVGPLAARLSLIALPRHLPSPKNCPAIDSRRRLKSIAAETCPVMPP